MNKGKESMGGGWPLEVQACCKKPGEEHEHAPDVYGGHEVGDH